jgi:transcription initiation factor TFIIIB Brf1 subunit/transcription initiation factor TFIIB
MSNSDFSDFDDIRQIKKTSKKLDKDYCVSCREHSITVDEGILVCSMCGYEGNVILSQKEEWSVSTNRNGSSNVRCGLDINTYTPQSSLGTIADYKNPLLNRLQQQLSSDSKENPNYIATTRIKQVGNNLKIDGILNDWACYIFVSLVKGIDFKRGSNRIALYAHCHFISCKKGNQYIKPEKLAKAYKITDKAYKNGEKLFELYSHYKNKSGDTEWIKILESLEKNDNFLSYEDITGDICDKLKIIDFDRASIIYSIKIIYKNNIITNKMPQSICAGLVWYYLVKKKIDITIEDVSEKSTVSTTTIKSVYESLETEIEKKKINLIPNLEDTKIRDEIESLIPLKNPEELYVASYLPPKIILEVDKTVYKSNRGRPRLSKKKGESNPNKT